MSEFSGKVAIVTGGASGIGEAIVKELAAAGAKVVVADRDVAGAKRVVGEITARGGAAAPFELDVAQASANAAMVDFAVATHGGLHLAVNNAGIGGPSAPTGEYPLDGWQHVMDVNLNGVFFGMRYEIPAMLKSGGGSIVNIASVHADATVPGVPAYAATKAAVVGLSRQMALDYAVDRIRVNAVLAGSVATRMTLDGLDAAGGAEALGLSFEPNRIARIANPSEIASAIGFLISDASSFVTGSAMQVDGGLLARLL